MRVPLSWVGEYVELTLPPEELARQLTFAGLEVEEIEYIGRAAPAGIPFKVKQGLPWDPERVRVGQIRAVKPHPQADRLTLAVVDFGAGEPVQVVTGAPNVRVGESGSKVVLALEGTRLYDGHKPGQELMTLKKTKIRGVESGSMVCSEKELGLSQEHEGILILPAEAPVGMPLADYLGDVVFEVKINPNMARAQSIVGIAREVAALTGQKVKLPANVLAAPEGARAAAEWVRIEIENPELCARYSARLIRGVRIGAGPFWMARRLCLCGMRPISNMVDITNDVMIEWGQPLHAFDYDKLVTRAGGGPPAINVRAARAGEKLVTLDGVTRELQSTDLLITDSRGPIALAGVMGGAETEIDDGTRNILLEAANFDFITIRRTTQAHKLPSEAATRFGRGIAPVLTAPAAKRAAELMGELGEGRLEPGIADAYPRPYRPEAIELAAQEVERQIGIAIAPREIERILQALDFRVEREEEGARWRVTPPEYRLDVDGTDDLVEEIARIYGYENVPATLIAEAAPPLQASPELAREEHVRDLLTGSGLQEVVTYSLTNAEREARLTLPGSSAAGGKEFDPRPAREYIALENPISQERNVLRQALMPGLLEILANNWRQRDRLALFEVGKIYLKPRPEEREQVEELEEDRGLNLPLEPVRLGLALLGRRELPFWGEAGREERDAEQMDFYDLKGFVEIFMQELRLVSQARYVHSSHPSFHPGRAAALALDGQTVGVFGELHPLVRSRFDLPEARVLVGEFDLEAILARAPARQAMRPLSRYPALRQDIALVVAEEVPAQRLAELLRETGGTALAQLELFDIYRGEPIPAGRKSMAYTLTFQAFDRVLTDADVGKLRDKIVARARRELGAELRSG